MPLNTTQVLVYGTLWTSLWGVAVWFGKDFIVTSRSRKTRKIDLLAFLNVWASEVAANSRITNANNVFVTIAGQFDEKRSELIRQVTRIESDFRGNKLIEFKSLVNKITVRTAGDAEGKGGRQTLLEAIDNLAGFLKEN